jgi:hypothetical protein
VSRICKIIKERCNEKGQNLNENIREERLLIFYCDMKLEWAREEYTVCCTRNDGSFRDTGTFYRVASNMRKRVNACIAERSGHFQHFI